MGPTGAGKSTVSFLRFKFNSMSYPDPPPSLLTKLLELKGLKSAMVWNLVLIKFKLYVASTSSKIVK